MEIYEVAYMEVICLALIISKVNCNEVILYIIVIYVTFCFFIDQSLCLYKLWTKLAKKYYKFYNNHSLCKPFPFEWSIQWLLNENEGTFLFAFVLSSQLTTIVCYLSWHCPSFHSNQSLKNSTLALFPMIINYHYGMWNNLNLDFLY